MRYEARKMPHAQFKKPDKPNMPHWCVVLITDDPANPIETFTTSDMWGLTKHHAEDNAQALNLKLQREGERVRE